MKKVRKRLRQYIAALLVVTMVFTQFGTSYAQGGMTGIRPYDVSHAATASDGNHQIPVIPEEDTEINTNLNSKEDQSDADEEPGDEIMLEDDRYGYEEATASESKPSSPSDAEAASRSATVRMASETYLLRYKAVVNGSWQIIYEEDVCEGDNGIPPEVPEREGYTFSGWSGSYVNVTASRTVTAKYVTGDQVLHTVRFVDETGRLMANEQYVADGRGAIRPGRSEYVRAGATFLDWDREFYSVTEDMEIRARYLEGEVPTRGLSYLGYYEGVYIELKYECVPKGENGTPPEVPAREGYTFAGWSGAYANSPYYGNVTATYLAGEQTVHKVRFVDENGRLVANEQYVADGKGANRPGTSAYKREGYTFLGLDYGLSTFIQTTFLRAFFRYPTGV